MIVSRIKAGVTALAIFSTAILSMTSTAEAQSRRGGQKSARPSMDRFLRVRDAVTRLGVNYHF
jgi:hypothetical protein